MNNSISVFTAILFGTVLLLPYKANSQPPEKISYQAVIRNSHDQLIANQQIAIKISILKNSTTGSAVYTETHETITNINGLISIEIGDGTIVSGSFSEIDWSEGTFFLKTQIDPDAGTNYTLTGTSQLLSEGMMWYPIIETS